MQLIDEFGFLCIIVTIKNDECHNTNMMDRKLLALSIVIISALYQVFMVKGNIGLREGRF